MDSTIKVCCNCAKVPATVEYTYPGKLPGDRWWCTACADQFLTGVCAPYRQSIVKCCKCDNPGDTTRPHRLYPGEYFWCEYHHKEDPELSAELFYPPSEGPGSVSETLQTGAKYAPWFEALP